MSIERVLIIESEENAMKVMYWSDYACPYCYIGETHLKKAIENLNLGKDTCRMIWLPNIYDETAGLTDHGQACLFYFWSYSTMRILVGSSRLPFIPMGSGGIQRMTGFFSGNTASRGPVQ